MILGQPIHTDDDVETTEFDWHKINFERHDNAKLCVMQSAFLTQGTVSSIPIVFSWGNNITPEGFLSSILLWLVIIVAVVGVGVVTPPNSGMRQNGNNGVLRQSTTI
ncbi:hypothetical protein Tco_0042910, partial [Tanacetum coccineum]